MDAPTPIFENAVDSLTQGIASYLIRDESDTAITVMVHTAAQTKSAQRVLVLPHGVTKRVRDLLAKLDIRVLEYSWDHK